MKQIAQRVSSSTPPFFKKLRNIGLILATIAGVLAAAPITLPPIIIQAAGYIAVAGGVASAVSQTAVEGD